MFFEISPGYPINDTESPVFTRWHKFIIHVTEFDPVIPVTAIGGVVKVCLFLAGCGLRSCE